MRGSNGERRKSLRASRIFFAMTTEEARQLLELHLPAREAAVVARLALPSVLLTHDTSAGEPAVDFGSSPTSRLGGDPVLPADVEWPLTDDDRPLSFLCQVRLDEVSPYDHEQLLPESGLLLAFYDVDEQPWGGDGRIDRFGWSLRVVDEDGVRARPSPEGATRFEPVSLAPSPLLTLPGWEERALDEIFPASFPERLESLDSYHAVQDAIDPGRGGIRHRVLGWPDLIQAPMQKECQRASTNADPDDPVLAEATADANWRMVLQIDTDDARNRYFMWGDVGRLYFWMRKCDLAARDFDSAWMILQCS
jgi:uncharacterized protein YwqG